MTKKKIVFCLQTMVMGGVEKELLTILNKFDKTKFDISILLFYIQDQNIVNKIPSNVRLINLGIDKDYYCSGIMSLCKQRIKRGKWFEAVKIAVKKLFKIGTTGTNIDISEITVIKEKYDIAVCYHIFSPIMFKYVATKVIARKKIAWVHNDFFTTRYPIRRLIKYCASYNEFVFVSYKIKDEFTFLCPKYKDRAFVAYNILDEAEIKRKSLLPLCDEQYENDKNFKLLTIGRFDKQKGIDLAIRCCKILNDTTENKIHWYLIGWGTEKEKYEKLIKKCKADKEFFILGEKANPYPYIKNCDIYVQPSRHEAFGLTILEAKILSKTMVCTDFAGAREQIEDGVNGKIVPVNDVLALADAINALYNDKNMRIMFENNLLKYKASNNSWDVILNHFA